MLRVIGALLGVVLLFAGLVGTSAAQVPSGADTTQPWYEEAWTLIVERDGVGVSYIFYPEADNENNGVVLRLRNRNDTPVRYAFTVIFRAPEAERSATVEGRLRPGEMKTGDEAGLFWIPFRQSGHSIGEVGLRGLEVQPLRGSPSSTALGTLNHEP